MKMVAFKIAGDIIKYENEFLSKNSHFHLLLMVWSQPQIIIKKI